MNDRGVSPVAGVILMVAATVIVASIVGFLSGGGFIDEDKKYDIDCNGDGHTDDGMVSDDVPSVDEARSDCVNGDTFGERLPTDVRVYDHEGNLVASAGDDR